MSENSTTPLFASLTQLCHSSSQACMLVDHDGNLLACNELAQAFFARPIKRWRGKNIVNLLECHRAASLEHITQFSTLVAMLDRACANSPLRVRLKQPSGDLHWFDVMRQSVVIEHDKLLMLISFFEVNRYERMEQALHNIEKAEAISLLAGSLAHDFNNLLSLIISYADLLDNNLDLSSPLKRYAQAIGSSAQKGAALMKTFSSISKQEGFTELVEVNLPDLVEEIEFLLARAIGKHVRIINRIECENARVFGDPIQLELALLNLFINARDAMGGKGTIEMSMNRREIHTPVPGLPRVTGEFIVLSVRDSGSGIPLELQDRIFEPFFTTKASGKGTGLGLATVKSVMERSGGFVVLESSPGQGARFDLYFPA